MTGTRNVTSLRTSPLQFVRTPRLLRVHMSLCVLAALVLPPLLSGLGPQQVAHGTWETLGTLLVLSVVNVELGRLLEGGLTHSHRPHKALSAWAFAANQSANSANAATASRRVISMARIIRGAIAAIVTAMRLPLEPHAVRTRAGGTPRGRTSRLPYKERPCR